MKWVKGGHDWGISVFLFSYCAQCAGTENPHTATVDQFLLYEVTMNSAGVDNIMRGAQNFHNLSEINGFLLIETVDMMSGPDLE